MATEADEEGINAEVIAVFPEKIKIQIKKLEDFKIVDEKLAVGSYLRVSDHHDCAIIAVIENFCIEIDESQQRHYVIEAIPVGFLNAEGVFQRGGNNIAIPPIAVAPAKKDEIQKIYDQLENEKKFVFASLSQDKRIKVPLNGDKFFNKHIAVVGSTGSGKSHTIAKIFQEVVQQKSGSYAGLNNSHILIFDIHAEYKQAFPLANHIDIDNLILPYWLLNGEELEELLIETGENQAYNQSSILRRVVTRNKQKKSGKENVYFDSPSKFSIKEILNCIVNLSRETKDYKNPEEIKIKNGPKKFDSDNSKYDQFFEAELEFEEVKSQNVSKGAYNDGSLEKFVSRIRAKTEDKRLSFLFGSDAETYSFEDTLRQFIGYKKGGEANVTIIDLSGIPFEVLSITVSLISRILFEYGYFFKRTKKENKTPLLLVYEEAHKYVPKTQSAKFNASRVSIERIAKEGRKYGVTLMILSQRPAEISETIFSQCNNFIAMRLTNPEDQHYVKRLLPDALGPLTGALPTLESGEAIFIGDACVMPSLVKIDRCLPEPSSNDVPYLQEWKKKWAEVKFGELTQAWVEK